MRDCIGSTKSKEVAQHIGNYDDSLWCCDLAVRALKQGASDFVLKPWNNERLMTTVKSAYELRKSKQEIHNLKKREQP